MVRRVSAGTCGFLKHHTDNDPVNGRDINESTNIPRILPQTETGYRERYEREFHGYVCVRYGNHVRDGRPRIECV